MLFRSPEVLALRISEPFGLAHQPHPIALPEISIGMYWHAKFHRDAANRWLRDHLAASSRDTAGEAGSIVEGAETGGEPTA